MRSAPTRCSRRTRTSPATSTAGRPRCPSPTSTALVAADGAIALELVHCGNGRTALYALARAREAGALGRVILGNDAPSGTGVVPLGILRLMAHLASLGDVAPETVVAFATGNTARVHRLDTGVIAPGKAADL